MLDTKGMKQGYYWIKTSGDEEWFPIWFDGEDFIVITGAKVSKRTIIAISDEITPPEH